ncbi:RecQ family ATP-dependent DNA helicase [Flavobacterium crassostreae]|uniref:ATP-dependent DNA helicase RecQ n=1 Tax=Flavobacterium crassostreae TaxID=1763534 RepID=A0A1B9E7K8_9FLAO|nr:ATP-dependent DNA helicase RecQ [Flavobacterium crassostreae]OCB77934.1 recombinase RecQ [Flavobacterium crassostreae]
MSEALKILQKYWKHQAFRPLQEEIIEAVMSGQDTFALLPTGGGKSVCFQVPALLQEGICLVLSPLVALMKDQVANLNTLNIKAMALTGGIKSDQMTTLLDNCKFGNYKFLYLSPERLQSDWILERLKNLPINLIAIDEAHCVSQWGHDFRPAYLKIAVLKTHFPKTPFLALTASATPRAKAAIMEELGLENPRVFQQSFYRANLAYMVFEVEDKLFKIEQILKKNPEPSIIYVRNRKSCVSIATQLQAAGFKATYYHGGLDANEKEKNMALWIQDKAQVIVATNAFGMGIDKANVKTVIHVQLPENLENYYQEAGRAGRNEQKAFAVLLTSPGDSAQAENQFLHVLSDKKFLNTLYKKLCNHLQIAYGEGIQEQFAFNLNQFCTKYGFPLLKTYAAFQFLDRQGILTLSQEFSQKISLQFLISSKELLRYTSLNPNDAEIIYSLLRTYPGIYEVPTVCNLQFIAKKTNRPENQILALLHKLKEKEIVSYNAKNKDSLLTFNEIREDERTISKVAKRLENQNQLKHLQFKAVIQYVTQNTSCKSNFILEYFGEKTPSDCGICSYCIAKKQPKLHPELLSKKIITLLKSTDLNSREIQSKTNCSTNDTIFAIQNLLHEQKIHLTPNNKYTLKI